MLIVCWPHTSPLLTRTRSTLKRRILIIIFRSGFRCRAQQATPPDGWLKCNGATFDKAKYPKLAVAYPSGSLPDLRGEFLRGWDDGRGVDTGRALLSLQAHSLQIHNHFLPTGAGTVAAQMLYMVQFRTPAG